jgi:transcriptional regulator with XRE-family HTH domain
MQENQLAVAFGSAVRRRRERLKISQDKFADQIGMHRAYYSSIERGERNLTLRLIARVARGLNVRVSELMVDADL